MDLIEFFNLFICLPDRWKTCSLCCHNVHTDTEISAQSCNTRSYEFHNFILYIAVGEYFADDCKCNVLRSYSRTRFPFQIDCHNTRHIDVICLGKELFYKFSATFTHSHGTKRTITGMAVWTKDHLAAACQHFACKLVDNSLMRRYINSAIFLRTGQSKHMVIFIDCTTNCTKRVMTVCQYIRNREFLESWCTCCLNNTNKSDIVRCQLIKFNLELFHISGSIVCFKNSVCHCISGRFFSGYRLIHTAFFNDVMTVHQINATVV